MIKLTTFGKIMKKNAADKFTTLNIGSSEKVKGEYKNEYVTVTAFGKIKELIDAHLHEGNVAYFECNQNTNKKDDNFYVSWIVERMKFIPKEGKGKKGDTNEFNKKLSDNMFDDEDDDDFNFS